MTIIELYTHAPNVCNTYCARFRQGDCPFNYETYEEKCPRWREYLHPIEEESEE